MKVTRNKYFKVAGILAVLVIGVLLIINAVRPAITEFNQHLSPSDFDTVMQNVVDEFPNMGIIVTQKIPWQGYYKVYLGTAETDLQPVVKVLPGKSVDGVIGIGTFQHPPIIRMRNDGDHVLIGRGGERQSYQVYLNNDFSVKNIKEIDGFDVNEGYAPLSTFSQNTPETNPEDNEISGEKIGSDAYPLGFSHTDKDHLLFTDDDKLYSLNIVNSNTSYLSSWPFQYNKYQLQSDKFIVRNDAVLDVSADRLINLPDFNAKINWWQPDSN